jgi:osmoprotectant transport system permease protein
MAAGTGVSAAVVLADGSGLPGLSHVPSWLGNGSNWQGTYGVPTLLWQQVVYTVLAVVTAAFIALPIGLAIGHTGRGVGVVSGVANAFRAVPILGLLLLLVVWLSPKITYHSAIGNLVQRGGFPYFVPLLLVLVVLAIPPILTNTYAGVQNVDPAARDAARGMGMTGSEVVRKVELPCALPLILAGVRSATLQVVATATIAAYVPLLGGLGALIFAGDQTITDPKTGYPQMVAAGILVAVLAVVSPGLSGRYRQEGPALTSPDDPRDTALPDGEAIPTT